MQDKLGPISDLVAELKQKKPMTQSEEIDLLQTLEFFSRDMDSGEMNNFVKGIRDEIEESISNKGVEKGIDLSEIKKVATRTKTRIKDNKKVIEEDNRKIDSKLESKTSAEYNKSMTSDKSIIAEFNIAIDRFISSSFPQLPPAIREALKEKIQVGEELRDEYEQECKNCRKNGKETPKGMDFFKRKSIEKGISIPSLVSSYVLDFGVRACATHHMAPKEFVDNISQDTLMREIAPEKLRAIEKVASLPGVETPEQFRTMYYNEMGETPPPIKKPNFSMMDFYNEAIVVPTLKLELAHDENVLRKMGVNTAQHYNDLDNHYLSKMMIERARQLRKVNINRMAIASMTGEKNPVISDEIRKAIIEEFKKGELPVAKIFEKFRKEDKVKGAEVTAYDFIDVVAQELESKNMSEEACKKFIANEEQIADEIYEMEAREIIRGNTEKSSLASDEHSENIEKMETLRQKMKVRSQYSARFAEILRDKEDVKGKDVKRKREIFGFSLKKFFSKGINAFEDIALMSTVNTKNGITFNDKLTEKKAGIANFFAKLRQTRTTTQEVTEEKDDIVPLANNSLNRTVNNEIENKNKTIKLEEIHTGDQQEASLDDDGGRE